MSRYLTPFTGTIFNRLFTAVLLVGLALVLALAALHLGPPPMAYAGTTITVNTTADELNDNGNCSLREAIQAANTDTAVDNCPAGSGADTITLPAGTYTLTISGAGEDNNAKGDLDITDDLTINGAGSTIIDANQLDRVLHVLSGVTVEVNGVTLTNGKTVDGGASGGHGGGIYNAGTLTLNNCAVTNSTTGNGGDDAGTGGSGGHGGDGGGIHSTGTMTLTNSTVMSNTTGVGGSAAGNGGHSGYGGGVYSSGNLTLQDSTVRDNTTGAGGSSGVATGGYGGHGGGVYSSGNLTIQGSTVRANTTGIGGSSTDGNGGNGGDGGGVYNSNSLTLQNSTVSGNIAGAGGASTNSNGGHGGDGGGVYNSSSLTIENGTVSGNTAGKAGSPNNTGGDGGGIYNAGTLTLNNAAVTNNTTGETNIGSENGRGGGIYTSGSTTTITNTILAGNTLGSGYQVNRGFDCYGTLSSQGYNLVQTIGDGCALSGGTGDITGQDPKLSPLADNGGSTQTHALQNDSPAIDAGNPATPGSGGNACLATDQRGTNRDDWRCDIGAFEHTGNTVSKAIVDGTADYTFGGTLAKLYVNTRGSLSNLEVTVYPDTAHPNENANGGGANILDRYYTLTPTGSGFTVDLCLAYDDDEVGSLDESQFRLCRWTGSAWSCPDRGTNSSTTDNLVCADNVTELSDWTMGAVGADGGPTAIRLQSFRGTSGAGNPAYGMWALLAGLVAGLVLAWRWASRRSKRRP
jgi:CSLREA domain-containing protein